MILTISGKKRNVSLTGFARFLERSGVKHRFKRAVTATPPVPAGETEGIEVHMLTGGAGVYEAIAAAKSFLRFAAHPLVVHDDGTLSRADRDLLDHHLPGSRIIPRSRSDAEVMSHLEEQELVRCAELRRSFVLSPKLFDLRFYSVGKRVLFFDTDVLFHRSPELLLQALERRPEDWSDRYNEDSITSYSWDPDEIEARLQLKVKPRINSGLMCIRRTDLDWELFERSLEKLSGDVDRWYIEQTLNAIDLSWHGADPLPSEYDVALCRTSEGNDRSQEDKRRTAVESVVAQHYCGGWHKRIHYYRDFEKLVAPVL